MIIKMPAGQTEYLTPLTPMQVALDRGNEEVENAICALVDGQVVDMSHVLNGDCTLELLTLADPRAKEVYQHTAAHVLGQAVKAVFPTAKLVAAPATKDGFYYDVAFSADPDETTLQRLSEEIQNIIKADLTIEREEMSRTVAIKIMRRYGEYYKIQTIEALPKGTRVSIYRFGDFVDLTQGAHLTHTGQLVDVMLTGMRKVNAVNKVWRIEGKALTEKVGEKPASMRGRARTMSVRMPTRKRNNM